MSVEERVSNETMRTSCVVDSAYSSLGYNIEAMNQIVPLSTFDAIYLVDLCEPLCAVARARFHKRGWKNVHVICADAVSFMLPEPGWDVDGGQKGSISFITLSYSLSMVSSFCQSRHATIYLTCRHYRYPIFTQSSIDLINC